MVKVRGQNSTATRSNRQPKTPKNSGHEDAEVVMSFAQVRGLKTSVQCCGMIFNSVYYGRSPMNWLQLTEMFKLMASTWTFRISCVTLHDCEAAPIESWLQAVAYAVLQRSLPRSFIESHYAVLQQCASSSPRSNIDLGPLPSNFIERIYEVRDYDCGVQLP